MAVSTAVKTNETPGSLSGYQKSRPRSGLRAGYC